MGALWLVHACAPGVEVPNKQMAFDAVILSACLQQTLLPARSATLCSLLSEWQQPGVSHASQDSSRQVV